MTAGQSPDEGVVRKAGKPDGKSTISFAASKRYKRRLSVEPREQIEEPTAQEILPDGKLFAGEEHWRVLQKTDYLVEPKANECYITTQALAGLTCEISGVDDHQRVAITDVDANVRSWLGGHEWICEVEIPLRILPDSNPDIVKRLAKLPSVKCRVVPSKADAIVLGQPVVSELESRRIEEMEIGSRSQKDVALEDERIEELLEAARLQGMSEKGLARAGKLVRERARGVWRLKLGPDDVADLPAMPVELKPDAEPLPKPYMRRYSSAEMDYWRIVIDELLAAKVIRPSDATEVSPSNLVKKKVDGVWSTSVFRPIIGATRVLRTFTSRCRNWMNVSTC